jgi:hypothetical protein
MNEDPIRLTDLAKQCRRLAAKCRLEETPRGLRDLAVQYEDRARAAIAERRTLDVR